MKTSSLKKLISYLCKEKKAIFVVLVLMLFFLISQTIVPFLIGKTINSLTTLDNKNGVINISVKSTFDIEIVYMIICSLLIIIGSICEYFYEYKVAKVIQNIIYLLRMDVYKKLSNISITILDSEPIGKYVQYEINDMENISLGISAIFKQFVQGVFQILITIIFMFVTNYLLAIIVIFLSPISLFVSKFVAKFSHKHFQKQRKNITSLTEYSLEYTSNIDLVNSLNYYKESKKEFDQQNNNLKEVSTISQFSASWTNPVTRLVNNGIYVIVGIIGIIMTYYSFLNMAIGDVSIFLTYTSSYTKPFNEISSVIGEYETCMTSLEKINDFLLLNNDVDGQNDFDEKIESIEFKNVDFTYANGKKAIDNFNFKINVNEKIAIVGKTGSGKTTLVLLLLRFYEPTSGQILINGKDIRDIKKSSLRNKIGMVLQDTWLFNGSVIENLQFGNENVSTKDIKKMCEEIGADSFINTLQDKYNTIINSSSMISEGQKQILNIIRALLENDDIIVLDEATSNIDTRTENIIKKALNKLTKNKTSIFIAHRLSTITNADKILALKDGKLVEYGSHVELLKKKSYYYDIYHSQFK